MRVVRLRAPGGPEQLAVEEAERPRPAPDEALVRVQAAAITRGELEWPVDRLPAIPSYELCGVVEEAGAGVAGLASGDEVFALTPFDRDGVAAEYTALPAKLLVPKPRKLCKAVCAALPLPALTAWQGLFDHGRLAAGERVVIHGASGAVGGLAVQLARAHGAHVVSEDAGATVDLVFDTAGGERLRRSAGLLRDGGRLVSVVEEPPDGGEYFTVEPNRDQLTAIARLADAGELRPPSVEVYPLAAAGEAFARSLERGGAAKVVLAVAGIAPARP
jgi:NADPH:quinone reductase-like Zn-dependent oxidoreductase